MRKQAVRKWRFIGMFLLFLLLSLVLVQVCRYWEGKTEQSAQEPYTVTGFAFDTTYTITLYQGGSQEILNYCTQKCAEYEQIFSRTAESSELYRINRLSQLYAQGGREAVDSLCSAGELPDYQETAEGGLEIEVSAPLAELITQGIRYGALSQGTFDITIEPVSRLWDFQAETPAVPAKSAIEAALPYVDYTKLTVQERTLRIQKPGMGLDLGGIAKGYIADCLKTYLVNQGVTSGILNLGGNVLCIGEKPDGSCFQIGIQYPFADQNESIATVAIKDISVVSSGIYERYFTEDDTMYHHILDPQTGYPRENELVAVTILSERSVDGDGLSTTCFSLGLEEGQKQIASEDGVSAVFITKDGKLHYAGEFEEYLLSDS